MSTISVRRMTEGEDAPGSPLAQVEEVENTIRENAEQLFHSRGGMGGSAMDDWLQAERRVCWAPQAELSETDTAFHLLVGVPGLDPEEIEVILLPRIVILQGKTREQDPCECQVHFSDFGAGNLFRRIAFPSLVHVESAVVTMDRSMLKVSAAKLEA